jgi:hypothetical protein
VSRGTQNTRQLIASRILLDQHQHGHLTGKSATPLGWDYEDPIIRAVAEARRTHRYGEFVS